MKKVISLICALLILLSVFSFAFATDTDTTVPNIVITFEKLSTAFVSLFDKAINAVKRTDESSINIAAAKALSYKTISADFKLSNYENEISAERWIMTELTFTSVKTYQDSFNDVDMNLVLSGCGRQYIIPSFWNGNNEWKVRFVCPLSGTWYYETVCTDISNSSLHGKTGKINCVDYSGKLDIYRHGFVTTDLGKKYFTYDDGTPFLYLGDTHWSLGDETLQMVNTICEKRASQHFTVFQSEPIGATFDFTNGIDENDISGLNNYDEKFKAIAAYGLVHANAEFFFPGYMQTLIDKMGGFSNKEISNGYYDLSDNVKNYLQKISRYWVARYSAFPVIWTLGQEVDSDFYTSETEHPLWGRDNNPYILIAQYISEYDPYSHPLTAHQEHSGKTVALGKDAKGKNRYLKSQSKSIFIDDTNHDFFAAQWSPSKTSMSNFSVEKDYWYNSNGKPTINYEGQYCGLWTKNYGARMQVWCAYLNGMYGAAWGGHDTWSYLNIYDEDNDSSDGVDTITAQEKQKATWLDALDYESTFQCGYMVDFLSKMQWYNLIPRFDNHGYFAPCSNVYYCLASNKDNSNGVIYFYSFSDSTVAQKTNAKRYGGVLTGTLGNLEPNSIYTYRWFNPITGEASSEGEFKANRFGMYFIGQREFNGSPISSDMVFSYSIAD